MPAAIAFFKLQIPTPLSQNSSSRAQRSEVEGSRRKTQGNITDSSTSLGMTTMMRAALIAHEEFLARETGTIVVFMVGLCRGGPNQLDWCAQLRRAQQSAQNGEER
jgi:hypothetical protein